MDNSNSAAFHFTNGFQMLAKEIFETAVAVGWWEDRFALLKAAEAGGPELVKFAQCAIDGMSIALKHSELSEALEGIRHGNPPDNHIPQFTAIEAELADVIIRIMDTAYQGNHRVAEAVLAKIAYNKTRARKHGGKVC